MQRRQFLAASAAIGATSMVSTWASAAVAELPKGTIKIYVGWAPGGGTDVFARIVGQKLGEIWGRPVVVENKPGATGALCADYFAKAKFNDGLNLLMAHVNTHAISPRCARILPRIGCMRPALKRDEIRVNSTGVRRKALRKGRPSSV